MLQVTKSCLDPRPHLILQLAVERNQSFSQLQDKICSGLGMRLMKSLAWGPDMLNGKDGWTFSKDVG